MYLDGVLQSTYYSGGNYVVKTNNQLGIANLVGYGYDFYGLLDDIRIYNRALSDHEVMTIYRDSVNAEYTAINRSDDDTSKITGARYLSMIWPKHRSMLHGRGCGL
jgi:hypothetical protein